MAAHDLVIRSEIDAAGALVTPGFVDIDTHYDGQATGAPPARLIRHAG